MPTIHARRIGFACAAVAAALIAYSLIAPYRGSASSAASGSESINDPAAEVAARALAPVPLSEDGLRAVEAIGRGDLDVAESLSRRTTSAERTAALCRLVSVEADRWTPLADTLVSGGADPSAALAYAANPAMMAYLFAKGASANARDADGDTALHAAVRSGQAWAVSMLLERGADPAAKNDRGETPRDIAERDARPNVLAALSVRR